MKILYAIQGTGNGHLSRARDIVPLLQRHGQVDLMVSGTQADVSLPFEIKYQLRGWSFVFGRRGGVDLWATYKNTHTRKLRLEIRELPITAYDLVINDFEPVSAWACQMRQKPCVALSHQAAVLAPNVPQPKVIDPVGRMVLKAYAPATVAYGFHFARFNENLFTPVIRQQVRQLVPTNAGHYTVYLPAYGDERLLRCLGRLDDVRWEVFSKRCRQATRYGHVWLRPIDNDAFLQSMASSAGVLCGAGFETPAEALFLGKKLLVVPMKNQYEQQCNAAALAHLGVPVIKNLKKKRLKKIRQWLEGGLPLQVDYPDETAAIIETIVARHAGATLPPVPPRAPGFYLGLR